MVLHQDEFCRERFKQALKMFEGTNCLRHFVKIDNREPDPLGYVRIIKSIHIHEVNDQELSLMYPHTGYKQTLLVEVNARSFLRGQIRIMIMACLKFAKGWISEQDMQRLFTEKEVPLLENGREWDKRPASPFGLYLTDIQYDPEIFQE